MLSLLASELQVTNAMRADKVDLCSKKKYGSQETQSRMVAHVCGLAKVYEEILLRTAWTSP